MIALLPVACAAAAFYVVYRLGTWYIDQNYKWDHGERRIRRRRLWWPRRCTDGQRRWLERVMIVDYRRYWYYNGGATWEHRRYYTPADFVDARLRGTL